jgi:hypothetical protein
MADKPKKSGEPTACFPGDLTRKEPNMAESNPGPFWSHFAGKRTFLFLALTISICLCSTAIMYGEQTEISASHTSRPELPKA